MASQDNESISRAKASVGKVARWFVEKGKPDEAVALLAAWASVGRPDQQAQELLAEALRIDPSAALAQQAFERMEGVTAADQAPLDAAIARFSAEEVLRLDKEISRPKFLRAQVGFNNNVKYIGQVFHIQTEDSGLDKPHIITHLFADGGRVVKSHKRSYADEVHRDDVAMHVRALMKGQQMEMAIMLREGRFDDIIEGKAIGGMSVLDEPPRLEVKKLGTKKQTRAEAALAAASAPAREPANATVAEATAPPSPDASAAAPAPSVHFRLNVVRSLTGGPDSYTPAGDEALVGSAGQVSLPGEVFSHPRQAQIRWAEGHAWLEDLEAGNGVFLRIRHPIELDFGDEFIVGDQLLAVERNPIANDGPDPAPTYFYSSPKWPSAFRVVQVFEGGAKGACVVARGTTMQLGSAIGDFVFTDDPLVSEQHCLVEEQAGAIVLTDLDSRTGVFVRIKGEQELVLGDELLVGRTRLQLELL